jgi:lipopolysaccharide export system permease protein
MKIIDRYLIREIFPSFMMGIIVFTFVILMSQFLRLVEMIMNKGVGILPALRLIIYLLPSILVLTIPMAVLLGSMVAFGRMSADNEITALKTGGYSLFRLALPPFFFSLAAMALTFQLIGTALPLGNQAFRNLMFEIVRGKASIGLRERVFNDDFDGLIIYINEIPVSANPVMKGIMIHDYRGEMEKPRREAVTIFSEEGWLVSDEESNHVVFRLRNGSIHSLGKNKEKYQQLRFKLHDLRLTMGEGFSYPGGALPKGLREMTIPELKGKIEENSERGLPVYPPQVELHKKYAIPFACLIFGLLGVSLGTIFRRGEKMVSFALCLAVIIVYYVFLVGGEPAGKQGLIPPWLAMWQANIFFSAVCLLLFWAAAYEKAPTGGLANRFISVLRIGARREGT